MEATMEDPYEQGFAVTKWTAYDIHSLRDEWTIEQCHHWLMKNEIHVRDRMIDSGWDNLELMLPQEPEKD